MGSRKYIVDPNTPPRPPRGVAVSYYSPYWRKWITRSPPSSAGADTPRRKASRAQFSAAVKMIKNQAAEFQLAAIDAAAHTKFLPRDLMMLAAFGKLYEWTDQNGQEWTGRRVAWVEIQTLLASISITSGAMLIRTPDGWIGLDPSSPGKTLQIGDDGLPAWATGSTTDIQALLDTISSTEGALLIRGASSWISTTIADLVSIQSLLDTITAVEGDVMVRGASTWEGATPMSLISATALLDTLASTEGDILFRGSAGWQSLAPDTSGRILQTNGPSANPSWVDNAGGSAAAGLFRPDFVPGNYYFPVGFTQGVSSSTPPANTLFAYPFYVQKVTTFTKIGTYVSASGTGLAVEVGVYTNSNGKPAALVHDSGSLAATSTGLKEQSTSFTLQPGWYWLAFATNGAVGLYYSNADSALTLHMLGSDTTPSAGLNVIAGWQAAWTYSAGNLPSTFPTSTTRLTYVNAIHLRV